MNFELSEDHVAMRDLARDLLAERWAREPVRAALARPPVVVPQGLWAELAELGWLGVACDEAVGGSGQDILSAALLSQEAGRALFPGLLPMQLAAAAALERGAGDPAQRELLRQLIAGGRKCTLAFEEDNGSWGPDAMAMEGVAAVDGDGLALSGLKIHVPAGTQADVFLVAFRFEQALCLAAIAANAPGVSVRPMLRFDAEDVAELRLERVHVPRPSILCPATGSDRLTRDAYDIGTVLLAASLLGNAEALLEATTAYAKERIQFGRPIGSFQAVSHRLADVLIAVEIGRSLLYAACLAVDEQRADATTLVSAAKAWLGDAAVEAAEAAVQLHGGIGYTWDLDVHLFLRRARSNATAFGDGAFHRERIARYLLDGPATQK